MSNNVIMQLLEAEENNKKRALIRKKINESEDSTSDMIDSIIETVNSLADAYDSGELQTANELAGELSDLAVQLKTTLEVI